MKSLSFFMIILLGCFFSVDCAVAQVNVNFLINGKQVHNAVDEKGCMTVELGTKIKLLHLNIFDRVQWYIKYDNGKNNSEWQKIKSGNCAELQLYITGAHQLKIKIKRPVGLFKGLFNKFKYGEKVITLNHVPGDGATATKYPILLVPGVVGFDTMLGMEYFYKIGDSIRRNSNQLVYNVSVSPWQETLSRGRDLAEKIKAFLKENDPCFEDGKMKVNIIAHSHGATTSRVAINILATELPGRVASLTTIAGPHYGTPSSDGLLHFARLHPDGQEIRQKLTNFFQLLGLYVSAISGHNEYFTPENKEVPTLWTWKKFMDSTPFEDILATQEAEKVANDFTQCQMYKFNKKFPSAGLPPEGKYVPDQNCDAVFSEDDVTQDYNRAYGYGIYDTYIEDASVDYDFTNTNGETVTLPLVVGNGLGQVVDKDDPNAIQYYSFSGNGSWNTSWIGDEFGVDIDLTDWALLLFASFHPIVGQAYEDWPDCFKNLSFDSVDQANDLLERVFIRGPFFGDLKDLFKVVHNLLLVDMYKLAWCMQDVLGINGYIGQTDAFIPVDSSQFGIYTGTYYWNHLDEQNHMLGMHDKNAQDPIKIYNDHIHLLKTTGL
ncbi:MAG: hypothetical protein GY874_08170 [Desulfobacteraceae bacterium]|nr:hypothetical protein [Desulfobacteraceae bacterium]